MESCCNLVNRKYELVVCGLLGAGQAGVVAREIKTDATWTSHLGPNRVCAPAQDLSHATVDAAREVRGALQGRSA